MFLSHEPRGISPALKTKTYKQKQNQPKPTRNKKKASSCTCPQDVHEYVSGSVSVINQYWRCCRHVYHFQHNWGSPPFSGGEGFSGYALEKRDKVNKFNMPTKNNCPAHLFPYLMELMSHAASEDLLRGLGTSIFFAEPATAPGPAATRFLGITGDKSAYDKLILDTKSLRLTSNNHNSLSIR